MLWSGQDWSKLDFIKVRTCSSWHVICDPSGTAAEWERYARQGQERQSLAGSQQFSAGKEQMQSFCYTSGCRHAALIAHFEPNGAPAAGQACQCAPLLGYSMALSCPVLHCMSL